MQRNFLGVSQPFRKLHNGKKRLSIYKNLGIHSDPEMFVIKSQLVAQFHNNSKQIIKKEVSIVQFDLKNSLKNLFEIPNLFDATIANMKNFEMSYLM